MAQRIIVLLLLIIVGLLFADLGANNRTQELLQQMLAELRGESPTPIAPQVTEAEVQAQPPAQPEPQLTAVEPETPPQEVAAVEKLAIVTEVVPESTDQWSKFSQTIEKVLRELLAGEYAAVTVRFDASLSAALPEERLATVMEPVRQSRGEFVQIIEHTTPNVQLPDDLSAFRVTVKTERGEPLIFTITLNEHQQIAGMYVKEPG